MLEGQQYVGAVSGGQDGDFYGNLFVSDDLQGIDRLSRVGQAEPVTYETLLAQENVPDSFRKLNLTFKPTATSSRRSALTTVRPSLWPTTPRSPRRMDITPSGAHPSSTSSTPTPWSMWSTRPTSRL